MNRRLLVTLVIPPKTLDTKKLNVTFFPPLNYKKENVRKFLQQFVFSRELNLLFLSIFIFAIALGINAVSFPAILNKNGINAAYIGVAFMMDCLGGIVMSIFLSRIVSKMKMLTSMALASLSYSTIILAIYFYHNFYLWIVLAFAMGNFWFMYVITRQAWMNMLFSDAQRGVGLGIFSMLISAGLALGPVLVRFSGTENFLTFFVSAFLTAISFLLSLIHI